MQLRQPEQVPEITAEEERAFATAEAWCDYLDATRNLIGFRYDEVEPWAWARLRTRLRIIERGQAAA